MDKTGKRKILLLFSTTRLDDMLKKGNVWYIRHYEQYFDKVYAVYLSGTMCDDLGQGNTTLVSLGTGSGLMNYLLAPVRLARFARQVQSTHYLTADIVFGWWISLGLRLFRRVPVILMPVCIPEQIYASSKRSLSGMPIWLEKLSVSLTFRCAKQIVTGKNITVFIDWLLSDKIAGTKLKVVDTIVEELSSYDFFAALEDYDDEKDAANRDENVLLYVGRLHKEKLVADLIVMMARLRDKQQKARLIMVGDGPDRDELIALTKRRNVVDSIEFVGAKNPGELVHYYKKAAVFVSPLTGTALREAALCGTPVVAYRMDWVEGFLKHEENALLAEKGDTEQLAEQVIRMLSDRVRAEEMSNNLNSLAKQWWGVSSIRSVLRQLFDEKVMD